MHVVDLFYQEVFEMKLKCNGTLVTLWVNRMIAMIVAALIFLLPAVVDWYCTFRELTPVERTAIIIAFYCCTVFIGAALWNIDRLLSEILKGQVFIRRNVRRIRAIGWCCGAVSLICLPVACFYQPLIFLSVIMAFLCPVVNVVRYVFDAAVTIREENDLTI